MKSPCVRPWAVFAAILLLSVSFISFGQPLAPAVARADAPTPSVQTYLPYMTVPFSCRTWPDTRLDLFPHPVQTNLLYLAGTEKQEGTWKPVLYRSDDRGHSWMRLPDPPYLFRGPLEFPRNSDDSATVYAPLGEWVARSMDYGQTWEPLSEQPGYGFLVEIAAVDDKTLFLTLGGGQPFYQDETQGFYWSEDGGKTWAQSYQGDANHLTLSPAFGRYDQTIMMTPFGYHWNGGILRSTDAGRTWHRASEGIYTYAGSTGPIRFADGSTAFTLSEGELYVTTNEGEQWQRMIVDSVAQTAFRELFISRLAFAAGHTLWVKGEPSGWHISRDNGDSWTPLPTTIDIQTPGFYCLAGGHYCGELLYGRGWADGASFFALSYDGGRSWRCLEG